MAAGEPSPCPLADEPSPCPLADRLPAPRVGTLLSVGPGGGEGDKGDRVTMR